MEDPRPRIVGYESDDCELTDTTNADDISSNRVIEIEGIAVSTLDYAECMLNNMIFKVEVSNEICRRTG